MLILRIKLLSNGGVPFWHRVLIGNVQNTAIWMVLFCRKALVEFSADFEEIHGRKIQGLSTRAGTDALGAIGLSVPFLAFFVPTQWEMSSSGRRE